MKYHTRKEKGITLITLIITIVVLLILAGITIKILTNSGLIDRAKEAKSKTEFGRIYEDLNQKIYLLQIDNQGNAELKDFVKALEEDEKEVYEIYFDKKTATLSNQGDIVSSDITNNTLDSLLENLEQIYVINNGYEFKVNKKLEIDSEYDRIKEDDIVEQISLSTTEQNMVAGNTFKIDYTVEPKNANVVWTVEDSNIATVENGVVTAVAAGTTNVTATIKGKKISETCKINVVNAKAKIDETYFDTLASAVASVPKTNEEKTITLLENTTERIDIASGQKIIYNGGKYTLTYSGGAGTATIINNGTLTVKSGTIMSNEYPIWNNSKLIIQGGTIYSRSINSIVNWGSINISGGYIYNSMCNDYTIWQRGGTINLYGGKLQAGYSEVIYASDGIVNLSGSDVRMVNTKSGMPVSLAGGTVVGGVIKNLTSSQCELYFYTNNSNTSSVKFPTWTSYNGQDDIIWGEGSHQGNNVYKYVVYSSSHNNEKDGYITHVYWYDSKGNNIGASSILSGYNLR